MVICNAAPALPSLHAPFTLQEGCTGMGYSAQRMTAQDRGWGSAELPQPAMKAAFVAAIGKINSDFKRKTGKAFEH